MYFGDIYKTFRIIFFSGLFQTEVSTLSINPWNERSQLAHVPDADLYSRINSNNLQRLYIEGTEIRWSFPQNESAKTSSRKLWLRQVCNPIHSLVSTILLYFYLTAWNSERIEYLCDFPLHRPLKEWDFSSTSSISWALQRRPLTFFLGICFL